MEEIQENTVNETWRHGKAKIYIPYHLEVSFILPRVVPPFLFSYLALNPSFLPLSYHHLCVFPYNPPFIFPPFLPSLCPSILICILPSDLPFVPSYFLIFFFYPVLLFFLACVLFHIFLSYLASLCPSFFAPLFAFGCISHNLFLYLLGK